MTDGIIQKTLSRFKLNKICVRDMLIDEIEQELIERIKQEFDNANYPPHHDCWCNTTGFSRITLMKKLIGDNEK